MNTPKRLSLLILIDILLVWFSVITSYLLRFNGGDIPSEYVDQYIVYGIVSSITCTGFMVYFRLYNRIWQYASVGELISISKAIICGCVVAYFAMYVLDNRPVPLSIFVRNLQTTLLLIGGSRFVWRLYRDNYKKQPKLPKTLIVGAGECGLMIAKELRYNANATSYPIAFIDDDAKKRNMQILGLPVVGARNDIPMIVEQQNIEHIIIAMPSVSQSQISDIIEICKKTKAKLKIVPALHTIMQGRVTLNSIRDVQVEDLLRREPVVTDMNGISDYINHRVVLVTGAGGSIGSELCRQIASFNPKKLLLLGHGENSIYTIEMELRRTFPLVAIEPIIADIQDRERMEGVFAEFKPNVVFHAAAHKHVPLMEKNPAEAVKNNVFGTKNVADNADKYGTERFVLISSDKAVNPSSVMGTTKRIAEMYIQSLNGHSKTLFSAVRFGNVLGSRGSVIPLFKEQISRGGPVTVTHPEMVRYFMTIPEAVQLVIQAGALSSGGEIFVLDMGRPVKIAELAEDLIRLSGFKPYEEIEIEFTGIRSGEKLFEELLLMDEIASKTQHDRIFVSKLNEINRFELEREIHTLEQLIYVEKKSVKHQIEKMVPSAHRNQERGFVGVQ